MTQGWEKKVGREEQKDCQDLFYLICSDLSCSLLSELQTSTSEDRQFISLCIKGQGHMEGKEQAKQERQYLFFFLLACKCFFHCCGKRRKTSASLPMKKDERRLQKCKISDRKLGLT